MAMELIKPACRCIAEINAQFRETRNTVIVTTLFGGCAIVATEKHDSRKRGRPISALASYCPFCGTKYVSDRKRPSEPGEKRVVL